MERFVAVVLLALAAAAVAVAVLGLYPTVTYSVVRRMRELGIRIALRLLDIVVYGVPSVDPLALIGSAAILLLFGALACLPPARRAARADPAEVLRRE